jgi:hypothetical protein
MVSGQASSREQLLVAVVLKGCLVEVQQGPKSAGPLHLLILDNDINISIDAIAV